MQARINALLAAASLAFAGAAGSMQNAAQKIGDFGRAAKLTGYRSKLRTRIEGPLMVSTFASYEQRYKTVSVHEPRKQRLSRERREARLEARIKRERRETRQALRTLNAGGTPTNYQKWLAVQELDRLGVKFESTPEGSTIEMSSPRHGMTDLRHNVANVARLVAVAQ